MSALSLVLSDEWLFPPLMLREKSSVLDFPQGSLGLRCRCRVGDIGLDQHELCGCIELVRDLPSVRLGLIYLRL